MRSIQSIIFIRLFAVIILFFFVVSGIAYYLTSEAIQDFVVSDSSTSLSFIINNVRTHYESDLRDLDEIAELDGLLPFEEKEAKQILSDFLEFPNLFSTVHMYRSDGKLLFAVKRPTMHKYVKKPDFHQKHPSFVDLVERVLREKKSRASEVFYSPNGTIYQTYIVPVFSDMQKENVFGVLSGGVFPRLKRIDHILHGLQLGEENFILITDSVGRFITSHGITEQDAADWVHPHTTDAAGRFFLKETPDIARDVLINYDIRVGKNTYILLSLPIPELKLVITLGVNTERMEAERRELSNRLLVALVAGLLLSVVSSIVLGDRLSKPFRQIADAVGEVNRGNFTARVEYSGDDEIGYLASTVNDLTEKIQKSEYLGDLWSVEPEDEQIEDSDAGQEPHEHEAPTAGKEADRDGLDSSQPDRK